MGITSPFQGQDKGLDPKHGNNHLSRVKAELYILNMGIASPFQGQGLTLYPKHGNSNTFPS